MPKASTEKDPLNFYRLGKVMSVPATLPSRLGGVSSRTSGPGELWKDRLNGKIEWFELMAIKGKQSN